MLRMYPVSSLHFTRSARSVSRTLRGRTRPSTPRKAPTMPTRRRTDSPALTRSILVRVSEAEHARLAEAAADRACSVSHLVRSCITRRTIPAPMPARIDQAAVVQLQRIGGNLNQVVKLLHNRLQRSEDPRWRQMAEAVRAVRDEVAALKARIE